MNNNKETYVPSPFTLTLLDNFGSRRIMHRPNLHPSSTTHMSQHRSEARLKPDKEALLQQLRAEKVRSRQMNASSGYLKRQLSQAKPPVAIAPPSHPYQCITLSLKREIQALALQVEQQTQEITRIKTSKKYNRFLELITAQEVYQEQLKTALKRTVKNKYALNERKRMWIQHRQREEDTEAMDRAVRARMAQENFAIAQKIEEEDARILIGEQRQIAQLREKNRLIREILQLQQLTGKLFIVQGEQNQKKSQQNEQILQPPPLLDHQPQKPTVYDEKVQEQQSSEEEQDSSMVDQSSSGQEQCSTPASPPRHRNASF